MNEYEKIYTALAALLIIIFIARVIKINKVKDREL